MSEANRVGSDGYQWVPTPELDEFGACPICGADEDQQCSMEDPGQPGFGVEFAKWVHAGRLDNNRIPEQKLEQGDGR